MLRWQKWQKRKQPLPIQKPVTTLAPSPLIQLPFPSLMQRGQGTREVLAFIIRQSSTSQKTGGDNDSLLGLWTTWQRNRGSPERGCFFLCPFLTWTVTCQGSATLKTRGQVPGCREPTAFLHMVKTSTAAALAWRLRLDSRGGGKKTQRANALTLTRTPFTSATMHRDTKVTTSINTSHYEYCFQREAIHGIKTSTGSSSTRTTKLQVVRSGHDCA